jgi:2-methylcitrate dehydratase PrpD
VRLVLDPDIDRGFPARNAARVTIRTRDGGRLEARVDAARGTPGNPLSRTDVVMKFRSLAGEVLPGGAVDEVVDRVIHLEREPDLSRLMALLRAG